LSILLQNAPATSELILVYLSARKTLLENLERFDQDLYGSVISAAVPFICAAALVVTRVGVPFVTPVTLRSLVLMQVSSVLGAGSDR
jgi:hypothetical protein